jgi:hypothetical protein
MTAPRHDYDYASVRIVPCVPAEAFVTVGVVLHARTARFLGARLRAERAWIAERCPHLDPDLVLRYLDAFAGVASGGPAGGPIGLLTPSERFHWLTAPRSAALQTSAVHTGRTDDPEAALESLFAQHVPM